jgi:ABC-type sugar transport system ATPase subunit
MPVVAEAPRVGSPEPSLLEVRGLTKGFSGVTVLEGIDLSLGAGEVLMLVGENGAGKSTLKNILSGLIAPDAGEIVFKGRSYRAFSTADVDHLGIGTIHQELSLFGNLSVAENIHLPHLRRHGGLVDWASMRKTARSLLEGTLGAAIDPTTNVERLSLGERQLVEIAKAIHHSSSLLILDEPTTCLSIPERRRLIEVVRRLRGRGYGIIYITHFLEEVYELADRIVVLRDGNCAASGPVAEIPVDRLTQAMVGRELIEMHIEPKPFRPGAPVKLAARDLRDDELVRDVSFEVRAGEILGIGGLMGAGRSEIAELLVGLRSGTGEVTLCDRPFDDRSPRSAMERGLVLISEDRRKDQLFLNRPVRENLSAPSLRRFAAGLLGILRLGSERRVAHELVHDHGVQPPRTEPEIVSLSGGNQQKAIVGRWLYANPQVCILDEPTKGVDVGARAAIHRLVVSLAEQGVAFILISSDTPELLALCHRILVIHKGRVVGNLDRSEADPERILRLASTGADR